MGPNTHQGDEFDRPLIVEATNTSELDVAHKNYEAHDGDINNISSQCWQYQYAGVNDATNEALSAILIDKLECCQTHHICRLSTEITYNKGNSNDDSKRG